MVIRMTGCLHIYDTVSMDWRADKFNNVQEIADTIVTNWNATVKPDDMTVIVGDIGKQCAKTIEVLEALNGKKILVMGNHDLEWDFDVLNSQCGFDEIRDYLTFPNVIVRHIPIVGSLTRVVVHAHHHRYDAPNMQRMLSNYTYDLYRYNCCWDLNKFKPCTYNEIILNKELLLEKHTI